MNFARIADDYYRTPPWCVELILPIVEASIGRPVTCVLDPACGDGAILDVAREHGARTLGFELDGKRAKEARAKGHEVTTCESLGSSWTLGKDDAHAVIVANPPYSHALEFAERCAWWARERGTRAALLLPLGFAESRARYAFHKSFPSSMYVLAERPRFRTDTHGTDPRGFAWFLFGARGMQTWTVLDRRHGA